MTTIIGVRFRNMGKVYYFGPKSLNIEAGDHVIVETARGVEYGCVVLGPREVEDSRIVQPLKEVIRIATPKDDAREESNRRKEKEAFQICQKKIAAHNLDMKLIDAEYTFDNNKVLFYFTADGRVDFRELVKDLASVFKTRIELRQIGVRDETKILGGIGICGRPLCCHTYLSEFAPVSIKMAKEQNLSLNPTKISGTCGRLMCCLKYEQDAYEYLSSLTPRPGTPVMTEDGRGVVTDANLITGKLKVQLNDSDAPPREYHRDNVKNLRERPRPAAAPKEDAAGENEQAAPAEKPRSGKAGRSGGKPAGDDKRRQNDGRRTGRPGSRKGGDNRPGFRKNPPQNAPKSPEKAEKTGD